MHDDAGASRRIVLHPSKIEEDSGQLIIIATASRAKQTVYCGVHRRVVEVESECGSPPCDVYRRSSFCAWY